MLAEIGESYNADLVIAKFAPGGTLLWAKRVSEGGGFDPGAADVIVDQDDAIVVAGRFTGTANFGGGTPSSGEVP